jgi:glutamyl-tRNA synthetase
MLGWSPKNDEEIFSLDELVSRFSLEQVNRAPARFDLEKCQWVNQQHLMRLDAASFAREARPFVEQAGLPIGDSFESVMAAVKDKVRLLTDVPKAVEFLLRDDFFYDGEALAKAGSNTAVRDVFSNLAGLFEKIDEWSADAAKAALSEAAASAGAKVGQMMFPLRVALTGRGQGPDMADVLNILGKQCCISRVNAFNQKLA